MVEQDPMREMFNSIIDDKTEKKIMKMIIEGKRADEIIDILLGINLEGEKK
jgi:DNA-binding CsgD family transcriptional regulator